MGEAPGDGVADQRRREGGTTLCLKKTSMM